MKMNNVLKATLLLLVISINHGICADYTSIENELPAIEDPVDPQEPGEGDTKSKQENFFSSKIKIIKPGGDLSTNGVYLTCMQDNGFNKPIYHNFGWFESEACANEHIAQNADKCSLYSAIWYGY